MSPLPGSTGDGGGGGSGGSSTPVTGSSSTTSPGVPPPLAVLPSTGVAGWQYCCTGLQGPVVGGVQVVVVVGGLQVVVVVGVPGVVVGVVGVVPGTVVVVGVGLPGFQGLPGVPGGGGVPLPVMIVLPGGGTGVPGGSTRSGWKSQSSTNLRPQGHCATVRPRLTVAEMNTG